MTTIINSGAYDQPLLTRSNITIKGIEFKARAHEVSYTNGSGVYTTRYEKGAWSLPTSTSAGYGSLISISGSDDSTADGTNNPANAGNFLIEDCRFRNADRAINIRSSVIDVWIRRNEFITFDGAGEGYDHTTSDPPAENTAGFAPGTPQISGWGGYRNVLTTPPATDFVSNVLVTDNTYNGNPSVTSYDTYRDQSLATDGLMYFEFGGNYFAARNSITNNHLEGIYFTSGPVGVAQNSYSSFIHNTGTCALLGASILTTPNDTLTADFRDVGLSFVGNKVRGGAWAWRSRDCGTAAYKANFCGNDIQVAPSYDPGLYEGFRSGGDFQWAQHLNASGNTIRGYKGLSMINHSTNSFILKNDFSGIAQGGLFLEFEPLNSYAVVAKNIVNNGRSFHVYASLPEGQRIFVLQNTFRDSTITNSVQPVFDRTSFPIHFNP
jgi:hypothetical protein